MPRVKQSTLAFMNSEDENIQRCDGRRIVDLKEIAKGLNGCKHCGSQLSLLDTVRESREGLGSVMQCYKIHDSRNSHVLFDKI